MQTMLSPTQTDRLAEATLIRRRYPHQLSHPRQVPRRPGTPVTCPLASPSAREHSPAKMTTIVLAEDQHLVRQGFKLVLSAEPDFKLLGEAADGLEAIRLVEEKKPNILLLDLMIPRLHGLDVARRVHKENRGTRVI